MLRYGSQFIKPQQIESIRKPILPYHKTVRKIGNQKVTIHEKRNLLENVQVGARVLESVNKGFSKIPSCCLLKTREYCARTVTYQFYNCVH